MELTADSGRARYDAFVDALPGAVIGLDFDGVLAPIVEDPTQAHIHPAAAEVLDALGAHVRAVAVITGRPARQAIELGSLDELGTRLAVRGTALLVLGQYGNERWTASQSRIISPRPPHGLASLERELPALLRAADSQDAFLEEKGLAVAVHTRRLADPGAAYDRLLPALTEAAERHGLTVEPGRNVIEVRAPGTDKGDAVRTLADELDATAFFFAGDDLGDVVAFEAVAGLRERGMATLLVCAASDEQSALVPLADLVVPGPDGVLDVLRRLAADAG